jgi:hypothetical protein
LKENCKAFDRVRVLLSQHAKFNQNTIKSLGPETSTEAQELAQHIPPRNEQQWLRQIEICR